MKYCHGCQRTLPFNEFYHSKRDGYQSRCKACHRTQIDATRDPERARQYAREHYDVIHSRAVIWYQNHPGAKALHLERWRGKKWRDVPIQAVYAYLVNGAVISV